MRYHDVPQHEREDDEYSLIVDPRTARNFLIDLKNLLPRYSGMILAVHPELRAEFWDRTGGEIQFWAVVFDEAGGVDHVNIKALVHEECEKVYAYERERGIA
ncbi:hypothetical protein B8W69_06590 [Mycobacterium vulneris]|uniref:Uncharacterized protein n=1 Tax=Mycolicibacterium vulneris TaxID=547163 RepID=A0A1X2L9L2_9MYCO|nr:hypothetical protein [Mycolicibacterium vulneris]OSC30699.1 hypothetical protein B8W69_06590 [Mycolicibacterium vulneris]